MGTFRRLGPLLSLSTSESSKSRLDRPSKHDWDLECWYKKDLIFFLSFLSSLDIFDDSDKRPVRGDGDVISFLRGISGLMSSVNIGSPAPELSAH